MFTKQLKLWSSYVDFVAVDLKEKDIFMEFVERLKTVLVDLMLREECKL